MLMVLKLSHEIVKKKFRF